VSPLAGRRLTCMSELPERDGEQLRRLRATALSYEQGTHAPRVLASGVGLIAQSIVAVARESGVPVRRYPALVEALALLDVGDEIPEPLFVAVAEALAWAYRLDAQLASGS
jgi:flagellar biosynthesis protein